MTDEAIEKVKKFITDKGIEYVIAIKGADEYKTSGIPHAWLVAPDGKIAWEGHPGNLKDADFEEHLGKVVLVPQFSLPKELRSAQKDLNSGNYTAGLKALESFAKKAKPTQTEAQTAATQAMEEVKTYGETRLKTVDELAKAREYGEAQSILKSLEKAFKGHELGDKASSTLKAWKEDKAIKLELDGAAILEKADLAEAAKQYPQAAQLIAQVASGKKYEGTKVRETAEKRLRAVKKKIK